MEVAVQAQADSTLVLVWGDIFSEFFGGGGGSFFDGMFCGGGGRQSRLVEMLIVRARKDLEAERSLRIDMLEAYKGTKKDIEYNYKEACDSCHGSGAEAGTTPETCTNCGGSGQVVYTQQSRCYGMLTKI